MLTMVCFNLIHVDHHWQPNGWPESVKPVTSRRQNRSQAGLGDHPDANVVHDSWHEGCQKPGNNADAHLVCDANHILVTDMIKKRWQPRHQFTDQQTGDYPAVKRSHKLAWVTIPTPKRFTMVGTSIPGWCGQRLRLWIINGKKCLERGLWWLKKF